jgi:hypothetical protein
MSVYRKESSLDWNDSNIVRYVNILVLIATLAVVFSVLILAWVPPTSRDALIHHLAIPKLYLQHGGVYEIDSLKFSYYPMNLDLLYLIPLYLGNDIVPKYIHFLFTILTCWIIIIYLKNKIGIVYALTGALLFLSLPVIIKLSITAYVDLGLIFFSTASLVSMLKWMEKGFQPRYLITSALMCGLALGVKYNGLITLFLLTFFAPLIYLRSSTQKPVQKAAIYGVVFLLISVAVFSPWMGRNYRWTGNPIYPLYDQLFNPPVHSTENSRPAMNHFIFRAFNYDESFWETLSIPIRIFFQGQDDNPQYFDGKLNPLLFFLPLFAFSRKDRASVKIEKNVLLWFSILYLLFVFFQTDMRIRYVSPIIPPLVMLSMFGLSNIVKCIASIAKDGIRKFSTIGVGAVVIVLLSPNFVYLAEQWEKVEPLTYITGKVSRDEYLGRHLRDYNAIRFANEHLPEDAVILSLFLANRSYYSQRKILFNHNTLFGGWEDEATSKKICQQVSGNGITHLLIRYDLFERWVNDNFDAKSQSIMVAFIKEHLEHLFSNNGFGLFEIKRCEDQKTVG